MTVQELINKLEKLDKTQKAVVALDKGVASVKCVFIGTSGNAYLDVRK